MRIDPEIALDDSVRQHVSGLYPEWAIVDYVPPDAPKPGFLGGWAYSVPHQVRYILNRKQMLFEDLPALPADAARRFVRDNYKLPIRRKFNQAREFSMPLYAVPGEPGECTYVDMKAAYKTLVERVGYDVDYRRGKFCTVNPVQLPDLLSKRKVAYSILVSMSSKVTSCLLKSTDEGPRTQTVFNLYANVCLFSYVTDVMASCAADALRRFPIFYVHTDGFVLPKRYESLFQEFLLEWGFKSGVKASGETMIHGVGSWTIGNQSTRRKSTFPNAFRSRLPDWETVDTVKAMLQKQLRYVKLCTQ